MEMTYDLKTNPVVYSNSYIRHAGETDRFNWKICPQYSLLLRFLKLYQMSLNWTTLATVLNDQGENDDEMQCETDNYNQQNDGGPVQGVAGSMMTVMNITPTFPLCSSVQLRRGVG